jgi:hypothetical protein
LKVGLLRFCWGREAGDWLQNLDSAVSLALAEVAGTVAVAGLVAGAEGWVKFCSRKWAVFAATGG